MENLESITSLDICQFACDNYDGCNYFLYIGDEEECQLLSSPDRTCDLIRGPPTPSLAECSEKPSMI